MALKAKITISSTTDPVSELIAEIYGQSLEKAQFRVARKNPFDTSGELLTAMSKGEVQLTGVSSRSLLAMLNNGEAPAEANTTGRGRQPRSRGRCPPTSRSARRRRRRTRTLCTAPATFTGTNTVATLTDLGAKPGIATLAAPEGFDTATPLGGAALKELYGIEFKAVVPTEVDSTLAAIQAGTADCGIGSAGDPALSDTAITVLQDDKTLVPNDVILPLITTDAGTDDVLATISAVSARLTPDSFRALMAQMATDGAIARNRGQRVRRERRHVISVVDLSKRFGRTTAVDHLSFDVRPGTVTGFLGPNGSGKSTTMRCMLGLDRPDTGGALVRRAGVPPAGVAAARGRRAARRRLRAPRPQRPQPPALARGVERAAAFPGRRGARTGRADHGRRTRVQDLLARHAPTARAGRRAARRPAHRDPRRAGQRARPGGHPLDPRRAGAPRRRRADGARQQPPAVGDGADGQRSGRDRPGPVDRAVLGRRVRRPPRRSLGARPEPRRRRRSSTRRRRRGRRPAWSTRPRSSCEASRRSRSASWRPRRDRAARAVAADRFAGGRVPAGHRRRQEYPRNRWCRRDQHDAQRVDQAAHGPDELRAVHHRRRLPGDRLGARRLARRHRRPAT